jgi:hypothetical protein
MDRRDISRVLLGSVAGSVLLSGRAAGQTGVTPRYPQTAGEIAARIAPTNYENVPGDVRRYGAVGDGVTDCRDAIQAAIDIAEIAGGEVFIPTGIFRFGSKLRIDNQHRSVRLYGESVEGSILRKAFSGTGIEIDAYARPTLENFTLDRAGADSGVGIRVIKAANHAVYRRIIVTGQGSHGIEVRESNLADFTDVASIANGGDGIRLKGASTPDVNACTLSNIDVRENAGWGVNFDDAWANFAVGITSQSNRAGGVRLNNARQNCLQIYSESNAGPQIQLADNEECKGNMLFVLEGGVTYGGTTASRNTVLHMKRGPVFDSNFNKLTSSKFVIPNVLQDGTGVIGVLTVDHPSANQYDFTASGGGSPALFNFNSTDGVAKFTVDGGYYLGTPAEVAGGTAVAILRGTGTPEGAVNAVVGSHFHRTDGGAGTSFYVKESGGSGSKGWVAK